ncbi:MAG: preprotein translocase subunit SecE [Candidatus Babeliaceae bacterium]|nr:preprotein translocase subunit SecE [Candidatus Babeliaceae bacterium]
MKNVKQFISEVRVELARVEWPSFQEFVGATIVVLFIVFVFAVYLKGVDALVEWLLAQIIARSF